MKIREWAGHASGGLRVLGQMMIVASMLAPLWAAAAGIVPDGGTQTSVSAGAGGRQIVNIAPAVAGVSQNTYSSFNVSTAGASLNNVGINARTIVNQVTGTDRSLIEGNIDVLGSTRANLILANPNGITVNGGSFTNTGHVVLSTGNVSFDDIAIAPGVIRRDVVLDTDAGTIVVGPNGLTSALISLDLIAKNLLIEGPVNNTFSSSTAGLRLLAGTSRVQLDTSISPTDNANDWLTRFTPSTLDTAKSFAIDITAAGSLTSGRVQLIVNDRGPGVRSAGPLNASLGDFTLSSNGSVQFSETSLAAAGNAEFDVRDAFSMADTQLKASAGHVTLTASGPLTLLGSGILANDDIKLSANGMLFGPSVAAAGSTIASASGGVVLTSGGDIASTGTLVQGQTAIAGDTDSRGAVTLTAAGSIVNQSLPGTQLGVLFGVAGDVSLSAGGGVTNRNARILSNQNVSIAAGGDVLNVVDHTSGADDGAQIAYSSRGSSFLFLTHRTSGFTVDYGEIVDPAKLAYITADAGNVTIRGANVVNTGGSILSNDGAIDIAALGSLTTQAVFTGQAQLERSCFIFCHSRASSTVQAFGGAIEAGTDITLKAGTQITNIGGTVYATHNLRLDAPVTLAQAVLGYSTINRTSDLKAWFGNSWAAIYATDTGGIFDSKSGQVELTGEGRIDGGAFNAPGGVSAAGGIVTVRAPRRDPVTIGAGNHLGLVAWFGL
ncbi:filamentous hemagglutinin N-terminal domain-containing protein [Burkholderia plantarii]|uniref:two-partner secretion domain-containing protein n=1 Tax=Burkholderia plantarii TaxID=41899 RepID=UPI003F6EB942|nr:filamentous hemagglutinin N-terminal domain-containing protein [Burkholderia plantarii]